MYTSIPEVLAQSQQFPNGTVKNVLFSDNLFIY